MKFRDFFIEKTVAALDSSEQEQIDSATSFYIRNIKNASPKDLNKMSSPLDNDIVNEIGATVMPGKKPRYIHLDEFNSVDRSTDQERVINIFVALNCDSGAAGAYYDERSEIFLFHNVLKDTDEDYIHEVISHEAFHAVQHYKKTSHAYARAVSAKQFGPKRKKIYYSEPAEREATMSGIAASINKKVNDFLSIIKKRKEQSKSSDAVIFYYVRNLESLLKSIELFAKTPPENYLKYKELPIPAPIAHRSEFFEVLSNDPKLRREYQMKMLSLSQKMIEHAKEFLKKYKLAFEYIT